MVKCDRCGYEWETKSQMYFVTCPKCRKTIKIKEINLSIETTKNE